MAENAPTFFGDEEFPIEWEEGEKELLWVYDDLHVPNPVSPMYFDIGGWWMTCDYMFRRFGTPFAADWIGKKVNGYLYTAAVPANKDLQVESEEYQSRYVPRVPRDERYPEQIGAYFEWVMPHYAENFLTWWQERLRPGIQDAFERFDNYDTESASLIELAVLLEDAIDMYDRHWRLHWVLNFAQFSATMELKAAVEETKGSGHDELIARLQNSTENRNWDSIEALWKIKEKVKHAGGLVMGAFQRPTPRDVIRELETSEEGRRFLAEDIEVYQQEFGYKSMYVIEFAYQTWRENAAPIIEGVRGYLEVDYDFAAQLQAVHDDLEKAKAELMEGIPEGEDRERLSRTLEMSMRMNPLTPDHHFYIDQGTNARVRLVLVAIGKKLLEAGVFDTADDVVYLRYNELRTVMAGSFDPEVEVRDVVSERRDEMERATEVRPPDWIGTATEENLAFPYWALWGFPEKVQRPRPETAGEVHGLAASAGVVEGTARVVLNLDQFEEVQQGEIVVCRMTSPAWVVLFTRIGGLVTDAGGMASHPAVISREFGIPAVVGSSDATVTIQTGDRVRVNGTTGVVQVLK